MSLTPHLWLKFDVGCIFNQNWVEQTSADPLEVAEPVVGRQAGAQQSVLLLQHLRKEIQMFARISKNENQQQKCQRSGERSQLIKPACLPVSCPWLRMPWARHRRGLCSPRSPQSGEVERWINEQPTDDKPVAKKSCCHIPPDQVQIVPAVGQRLPLDEFYIKISFKSFASMSFSKIQHGCGLIQIVSLSGFYNKMSNTQVHCFTWLWQLENTAQNISHLLPLYLRNHKHRELLSPSKLSGFRIIYDLSFTCGNSSKIKMIRWRISPSSKAKMVSPNLTISCSGVIGVALELTIGTGMRPKSVSALLFSILEEWFSIWLQ